MAEPPTISTRIALGPAAVSTTASVGVGFRHGAKWYDAAISKFSFRSSNSVPLNLSLNLLWRQWHRARTDHIALTTSVANET